MVCPICGKQLERKQINFECSILICPDIHCPYPIGREVNIFEEKLATRSDILTSVNRSILKESTEQEPDSTTSDTEPEKPKLFHQSSEQLEGPCTSTSSTPARPSHSYSPPFVFKRSQSARSAQHLHHRHRRRFADLYTKPMSSSSPETPSYQLPHLVSRNTDSVSSIEQRVETPVSTPSISEASGFHLPPFISQRSDSSCSVKYQRQHGEPFRGMSTSQSPFDPEKPGCSYSPPCSFKRSGSLDSADTKKPTTELFEDFSVFTSSALEQPSCSYSSLQPYDEYFEGSCITQPPYDLEKASPPFIPRAESACSIEYHPHCNELFGGPSTSLSPSVHSTDVQQNIDYSLDFDFKTEDWDLSFSQELVSPKSELSFNFDPFDFIDIPNTGSPSADLGNPILKPEEETVECPLSSLTNETDQSPIPRPLINSPSTNIGSAPLHNQNLEPVQAVESLIATITNEMSESPSHGQRLTNSQRALLGALAMLVDDIAVEEINK